MVLNPLQELQHASGDSLPTQWTKPKSRRQHSVLGIHPPPLPSPSPSPNCEVAARPRGGPEQLLGNLGKGRGRGGGGDRFYAQNAATLTFCFFQSSFCSLFLFPFFPSFYPAEIKTGTEIRRVSFVVFFHLHHGRVIGKFHMGPPYTDTDRHRQAGVGLACTLMAMS